MKQSQQQNDASQESSTESNIALHFYMLLSNIKAELELSKAYAEMPVLKKMGLLCGIEGHSHYTNIGGQIQFVSIILRPV
jgi:hypothetical protein